MRKAIYTVLMDGYDYFPKPAINNPGWDNILFVDEKVDSNEWDRIILIPKSKRPDIASRDIKWRSHIYLSEYDLVVYTDANIEVIKVLPEKPFRIDREVRTSVREEADALNAQVHRWSIDAVENQMAAYERMGFPDDQGLFLNGFFSRYHKPEENEVCELTFEHVKTYTSRDMLSFPFAMWATGYKPENVLPMQYFKDTAKRNLHKKQHPILP